MVTVRYPKVALLDIVIEATHEVVVAHVVELTVIPLPKFAVVPLTQDVDVPDNVTEIVAPMTP